MENRLVPMLVTAVAVVALVVALTLMIRPTTAGAADQPSGSSTTSRIVMSGTGEAHVVPDQLVFQLVSHVEDANLSTALKRANDAMSAAMDTLRKKGVAAKDIASSGLDMSPVYDYTNKHQTLRGYEVTQQAQVTVRDLAKAGGLISDVVNGGGDAVQAQGISLSVSDPDAALADARKEAVAKATEKAKQYADAAGRSLGSVISIAEPSSSRTPQPLLNETSAMSMKADGAGAVPISAGEQTMDVDVTITWALG